MPGDVSHSPPVSGSSLLWQIERFHLYYLNDLLSSSAIAHSHHHIFCRVQLILVLVFFYFLFSLFHSCRNILIYRSSSPHLSCLGPSPYHFLSPSLDFVKSLFSSLRDIQLTLLSCNSLLGLQALNTTSDYSRVLVSYYSLATESGSVLREPNCTFRAFGLTILYCFQFRVT